MDFYSELVFEGIVTQKNTRIDKRTGLIHTDITFKPSDFIKGKTNKTIVLSFLGGQYQNQVLDVKGLAMPAINEKGIYFIESVSQDLINPITGWGQGHFVIMQDNSGTERITTFDHHPIVTLSASQSQNGLPSTKAQFASDISISNVKSQLNKALDKQTFKQKLNEFRTTP